MARKIQSVKVGRRRLVVRSSLLDFVQALLVGQDCACGTNTGLASIHPEVGATAAASRFV
jgi:hypothetical protein